MKISNFCKNSRCKKISAMECIIQEKNRYKMFARCIKESCIALGSGQSYGDAFESISSYIREVYSDAEYSFAWQHTMQAENDAFLFKRFFAWLEEQSLKPACTRVQTCIMLRDALPDGSYTLEGMVDLIACDKKGNYQGFIIHPETSARSMKGRSLYTNARTNLHPMVAKIFLEEEYPGYRHEYRVFIQQ